MNNDYILVESGRQDGKDLSGELRPLYWRRRADEELNEELEKHGLTAAFFAVARTFEYKLHGLNAKTSSFGLTRGGVDGEEDEYIINLCAAFRDWQTEMRRARYSSSPVFDITNFGLSPAEVDRKYNKYSGWSLDLLIKSLKLYNIHR